MDLFNLKRVEELEKELAEAKHNIEGVANENERLRAKINTITADFNAVVNAKIAVPKDCRPGEYCRVCEFSEEYYRHYYVSSYGCRRDSNNIVTGYICNRANVCKNFVQKKLDKE